MFGLVPIALQAVLQNQGLQQAITTDLQSTCGQYQGASSNGNRPTYPQTHRNSPRRASIGSRAFRARYAFQSAYTGPLRETEGYTYTGTRESSLTERTLATYAPGIAIRLHIEKLRKEELQAFEQASSAAGITVGEIHAWRAWGLVNGQLSAYAANYIWDRTEINKSDELPTRDNQHGFWALKTRDKLLEYFPEYMRGNLVFGEVALWGTMIEHEHGYRAEFAKVLRWEDRIENRKWPKPGLMDFFFGDRVRTIALLSSLFGFCACLFRFVLNH